MTDPPADPTDPWGPEVLLTRDYVLRKPWPLSLPTRTRTAAKAFREDWRTEQVVLAIPARWHPLFDALSLGQHSAMGGFDRVVRLAVADCLDRALIVYALGGKQALDALIAEVPR